MLEARFLDRRLEQLDRVARRVLDEDLLAADAGDDLVAKPRPAIPQLRDQRLEVADIEAEVARLRKAGATFRNDVVTGVGGKQILVEDPSGNPIELFQPTRPEARLR